MVETALKTDAEDHDGEVFPLVDMDVPGQEHRKMGPESTQINLGTKTGESYHRD